MKSQNKKKQQQQQPKRGRAKTKPSQHTHIRSALKLKYTILLCYTQHHTSEYFFFRNILMFCLPGYLLWARQTSIRRRKQTYVRIDNNDDFSEFFCIFGCKKIICMKWVCVWVFLYIYLFFCFSFFFEWNMKLATSICETVHICGTIVLINIY